MVVQPLDLQYIFVNTFAGSMTVFFFVAMAALAYLASRFRMPNQIVLMFGALFVVFFAKYYSLLYATVILLAGILIYFAMAKLFKG